jgi:hypothetical protein
VEIDQALKNSDGRTGVFAGLADEQESTTLNGATYGFIIDGPPQGGYTVNGQRAWGVGANLIRQYVRKIRDAAARVEPATPTPGRDVEADGLNIGLTDSQGRALTVGDSVKVTGSGRFGDVEGVVKGNREGRVDLRLIPETATKERPAPEAADDYTASTGRVTVIDDFPF